MCHDYNFGAIATDRRKVSRKIVAVSRRSVNPSPDDGRTPNTKKKRVELRTRGYLTVKSDTEHDLN